MVDDAALILSFIQKKAEFDGDIRGEPCVVTVNLERIKRTLFNDAPYAKVIFAKNEQRETIGFALYHIRYSSFAGKPSIWLDDLFVDNSCRSKGIGMRLMVWLEKKAKEIDATHLSWNANAKNTRGRKFYDRLGAELERTEGEVLFYRYSM